MKKSVQRAQKSLKKALFTLISAVVVSAPMAGLATPLASADGTSLTYFNSKGTHPLTGFPSSISSLKVDMSAYAGGNETISAVGVDGKVYTSTGAIPGLDSVVKADVTATVGMAIKSDGTLWSWGRGKQLGRTYDPGNTGTNQDDPTPAQVTGLPAIKDVAVGYEHVLALDVNGNVWSWGGNLAEQLGTDLGCPNPTFYPAGNSSCDTGVRVLPQQVSGISDIKGIDAGRSSSIAVTQDGLLMLWGSVCNVESSYQTFPTPTTYPGVSDVKQALADDCGITYVNNAGTVFTWGFEGAYAENPRQLQGLPPIESISTNGWSTRIARTYDGNAYVYTQLSDYGNSNAAGVNGRIDSLGYIGKNTLYSAYFDDNNDANYIDGGVIVYNYAPQQLSNGIYYTNGTTQSLNHVNPDGSNNLIVAGNTLEGHVSPDGTKLAFWRDPDLYVSDSDGRNVVDLSNSNATGTYPNYPVWSPDGTKLAYISYDNASGNQSLVVVNADGSGKHTLVAENAGGDPPSWSPDGTKLAFDYYDPDASVMKLATINADGTGEYVYPGDGTDWSYPAWSPDGTKLAFLNDNYNQSPDVPFMKLSTVNVNGSGKTDLLTASANGSFWSPAWAPDSSQLAFISYDDQGLESVLTIAATGGSTTQVLTDPTGSIDDLQWWQKTDLSQLAAPTNLAATSPTKVPALTWNAVTGASSYSVYRDGTKIASPTLTSYTDTAAAEGTHNYYVTAVNGTQESAPSNTVSVTVDKTRPTMAFTSPSSFTGPFTTGPTVTITGSDVSGLQSMAIHVYTSANQLLTTCGSATASQLAAGTMSCSLASLPNGSYYIKAGSFDSAGNNQTIISPTFTIQH